MKFSYKILILIIAIITSCTSWKTNLKSISDTNDGAINNAIYDFSNSSSLFKKHDVFSLKTKNINETIVAVSIIGSENKLYPTPLNDIGSNESDFPNRFLEVNDKLFIWYDSSYNVTKEIFSILSKYDHIDLRNFNEVVEIPELVIDDSIEGIDYYFCRNNLLNYKKVKTNIGLEYYILPKLNCMTVD